MIEYRHGALYVIEDARDSDSLLRDLRAIDDRIFLERQITLENEAVWCVVVNVGGDHPPLTILEWRDQEGNPLELSSGIVDRVARMDRDEKRLIASVMRQNAERIEAQRQQSRAEWREMGEDFQKRTSSGYSAVLPRGQYLRRSRDKRRGRGDKV